MMDIDDDYVRHSHTNGEDDCDLVCTHPTINNGEYECRWVKKISFCPIHNKGSHFDIGDMRKYMKDNRYLSKDVLNE